MFYYLKCNGLNILKNIFFFRKNFDILKKLSKYPDFERVEPLA